MIFATVLYTEGNRKNWHYIAQQMQNDVGTFCNTRYI
jgi:hypothetical protein